MDRRAFISAVTGSLLAAPLAAEAQPAGKRYRIAYVAIAPRTAAEVAEQPPYRAFVAELRRLGYFEGQNLVIERWTAAGRVEHYPELARDVAQSQPDVIVAVSDQLLIRLKEATTAPIVGITADPVAIGLASSLGRPGGTLTGFTVGPDEVLGKHLELLRQAVPGASRVAFLLSQAGWDGRYGRVMREAARSAAVTLIGVPVRDPIDEQEYQRAFSLMARERVEALIVNDHPSNYRHRRLIADLAARGRLPAIAALRDFPEAGGLMAYAPDTLAMFRSVAQYTDRILKGAKPGDLPFQEPTKFELVINLKTAKALGLTIPPSLLQRADQVVE
ncbi:MAG TPA: ABC transporter substrate-binding protein [Gemmatimonadales bacterium]|nr:ABC transporter substrate-binding protein [Gemmatimonadales bacterium]